MCSSVIDVEPFGKAYHVAHGAHEPRHFRDKDQYFGDDFPLPESQTD